MPRKRKASHLGGRVIGQGEINEPQETKGDWKKREEVFEYLTRDTKLEESLYGFIRSAMFAYVPQSFFTIAASSSGKYHPEYALGDGGLVRHTKAAVMIAQELLTIHDFSESEGQAAIAALILHDVCKPSKLHPIEVKLILEPLRDLYGQHYDQVIPLIESHMGQWDEWGKLPRPKSPLEKFVHLCDYLASRKCLIVQV